MRAFSVTVEGASETFNPGTDFADGERRQHWTLDGLQKLIRLRLWERRLDRRGSVLQKPPTVEAVRRLPGARPLA